MTAQAGGASPLPFHAVMTSADRDRLRREMRSLRKSIPKEEREQAARQIARIANGARLLRPGQRIAVYMRHGSEADLTYLIASAHQRGCTLYLPVIIHYRAHRMAFRRFDPTVPLHANRYGILEPVRGDVLPVPQLDVVFAPLVAFDDRGSRLGTGAGFYDRALRRLRADRRWRRPRVIGVGYELQRVGELRPAPWDVPLDAVITEKNLYKTSGLTRDVS
jgi:5-formyltetrahydrofolate cyclo-ligase